MAWSVTAQLTSGTMNLSTTDKLWFNGIGGAFGTGILRGQYPDGTHVSDVNNNHRCTSSHVHNTKYINATTVSIDGGGNTALPIAVGSCPLKFVFTNTSAVTTSAAAFYVYDGVTDGNSVGGLNVQAAEGGVSTTWVVANGSNNGLNLANQASNATHTFYVACSVSPSTSGEKDARMKIVLTYV